MSFFYSVSFEEFTCGIASDLELLSVYQRVPAFSSYRFVGLFVWDFIAAVLRIKLIFVWK